jgi:hypothetical protein
MPENNYLIIHQQQDLQSHKTTKWISVLCPTVNNVSMMRRNKSDGYNKPGVTLPTNHTAKSSNSVCVF